MKSDIKYLITVNTTAIKEEYPFLNDDDVYPLSSVDELIKFNEALNDIEVFRNSCSKFSLVGGKDFPETTRKILSRLISHSLALHINWSGRNDKENFKALTNVIKLIYVSVRKNPLAKSATNADIENVIKCWFRTASDREGGRAKRNKY